MQGKQATFHNCLGRLRAACSMPRTFVNAGQASKSHTLTNDLLLTHTHTHARTSAHTHTEKVEVLASSAALSRPWHAVKTQRCRRFPQLFFYVSWASMHSEIMQQGTQPATAAAEGGAGAGSRVRRASRESSQACSWPD